MSGESAQHVLLVERLIALVESRHSTTQGIMIFADHHSFAGNLPPMIGGYKPDLLAQDVPCTFQVIGEAKTATDFQDERTVRQIRAFLDHLALYENTSFYLAVPWLVRPQATYIMKELRSSEHYRICVEIHPIVLRRA
jgi:hypothetical protein